MDGDLTFEKPDYEIKNNNFGVANFSIVDFLKPNDRKVKMLSHNAPIKQFIDTNFSNLDLNTTARKELKKLKYMTSYHDLGSYLVVTFDLADEIGQEIQLSQIQQYLKKQAEK